MTMKSTNNEVRLYDELKALQPGNKIVVDGLDKYFAQFQFVGSKPICFYAETAAEAKSPNGDWDNVNVLKVSVTPEYETKPVPKEEFKINPPKAPKRSDFANTDEGEEEFNEKFTAWFVAYGKKKETAPAATITVPVEPITEEPAQIEPIAAVVPVNNIDNNKPQTTQAMQPAHITIHSTQGFNKAADYVAAYRAENPDLNWDSVKDWKSLCYIIGIKDAQIGADSARRVIDRIAAKNGVQVEPKVEKKQAETVTAETPAPVKVNGHTHTQPAPVKKQESAPVTVNNNTNEAADSEEDEIARQIAELLKNRKPSGPAVDMETIAEMIGEAITEQLEPLRAEIKANVKTIQVSINGAEPVKISGAVHHKFESVSKLVGIRKNVMLVGPAGSGKTTLCRQIATAYELEFYSLSVCAQTSKADLLGYNDANGNYIGTAFRTAYESGGVFLLDEIDAGNPNVLVLLNSALDNGFCSFADKNVKRHENFRCVAGANTFGTGATVQYAGRNPLDGATLNRFVRVRFDYDLTLEKTIAPHTKWCEFIQLLRVNMAAERVIISPRDTIDGGDMINIGFTPFEALECRILDSLQESLKPRVMAVFNGMTW